MLYNNRRHHRSGHLFQGRYKAIVVDRDAYFLELARYIVLNPVRAAMVKHPRLWAWSSYGAMMGSSPRPPWLTADALLLEFGTRPSAARREYQRFVEEGLSAEGIWKHPRGQIYLGDEEFVERMRERLGEREEDVNIPRVQQRGAVPKLGLIRRRYRDRDEAIRLAYETGAYSYHEIAAEFGVHFTTVGRIIRQAGKRAYAAR